MRCRGARGASVDQLGHFCHVGLIAIAWLSMGAVWEVVWDPENPTDQIGRVVVQTDPGDTVLVRPGTYGEHIVFPSHPLVLLSSDGPAATVLDGSVSIPGREGSILYALGTALPYLRVEGFTFRAGSGSAIPEIRLAGGAIALQPCTGCLSQVEIADCIFDGNSAVEEWYGRGGALFLENVSATITDCVFRNNRAVALGGHVYLHWGSAAFLRCEFDTRGEPVVSGQAIRAQHTTHLRLEDCAILGGDDLTYVYSISTITQLVELIGNRFLDRGAPSATYVLVDRSEVCCMFQEAVLRDNVFVGVQGAGDMARVHISPQEARVTIEDNTFVDCRMIVSVNYGEALAFSNNILARTPAWIYYPPGGVASCNDIWPDSMSLTLYQCEVDVEGNICADPLFCDDSQGDFRIAEGSPCAEGNAPSGCGQIGALGVGCQQTPVQRTTWGRIKHLYR